MYWPPVFRWRFWSLKRSTVLVGFVLTMLGTVGARVYVEPVEKEANRLDDAIRASAVTIELLKDAYAQYFMYQQQGSLIFAISTAATNDDGRDIIGNLRKMTLIDRSFSVRQIIGQLAIAGQLDFRDTSDKYQALIEKSMKDFTLANYMAVNEFERGFISQSQTRSGELQNQRYQLIQRKAQADQEVDRRRLVLLILAAFGSSFLLAANLITTKE